MKPCSGKCRAWRYKASEGFQRRAWQQRLRTGLLVALKSRGGGANREKLTVKKIINNEMFSFHRFECPQMWVWPQVPLGGPSPTTSVSRLPHASPGHPSRSIAKSTRGVGEERDSGEGRALAGGKGPPVALGVGGALQTAVGARPTSGGSQPFMSLISREKLCVNREKIGTKNPPFFHR